jgi:type I restriction enzyme M protein
MKSLKQGGQAAIVVPEGVLFQSNNAFVQVKRELLENFNLHTIVSLPPGIFLPYSGVKTNIVFFSRAGGTSDVWYYEIDPGYKLTKNKPIEESHFEEFLDFFPKRKESGKSWTVKTASFSEEVDLTAKNPNAIKKISHQSPKYLLSSIKDRNRKIEELLFQIEDSLER